MSAHPYRQKAATAPYPADSERFVTADSSPAELGPKHNVRAMAPYPLEGLTPELASVVSPVLNAVSVTSLMANLLLNHAQNESHGEGDSHLHGESFPQVSESRLHGDESLKPSDARFDALRNTNSISTPTLVRQDHLEPWHAHLRSLSLGLLYLERDNLLISDFSQSMIHQYLGANSQSLVPRMKTLELYRQNAKRSTDPQVLFQYAKCMLQTALLLESPAPLQRLTPAVLPLKKKLVSSFGELVPLDPNLKPRLLKEAQTYLKKLADKGYEDAQYLLGDAYSLGAFGKPDHREAFVLFLLAAKHGHMEAAFRTAHCYEEGLGTGRDARKGVDFLKMAAKSNHPAAMYKLGVYMFYARMGLPDNVLTKKMGIKWLERAANEASELTAAAPYELGNLYYNGFLDILLQDKKYALELYALAAVLGHVELAAILGRHYEEGDTVPQNANLLVHYYTMAALGGHPELMLAMCAWYLVGLEPHLPRDEREAFEWAKRAAACGLPKAQFTLANFFDKGIGCEQNRAEAQVWYTKAAEQGEERALLRVTNSEAAAKLRRAKHSRKDCVIA